MHRDALMTLERKLGQPQAVFSAFLDKVESFLPIKKRNSYHVINFARINSNLVGMFCSLKYTHDF